MNKTNLLKAANDVIKRWDSPQWSWDVHTGVYIQALRQAVKDCEGYVLVPINPLDEMQALTNSEYETLKALNIEYLERVKALEAKPVDEPVAYVSPYYLNTENCGCWFKRQSDAYDIPLYTAPPSPPSVQALIGEIDKIRHNYNELLYSVSMKHPNETRYETALRYIRQAELTSNACEAKEEGTL